MAKKNSSSRIADSHKPPPERPSQENSLERLQKRSFGGEDVAARPGADDDDWWPRGRFLPGVEELVEGFSADIGSLTGAKLVFLLGGAGNGKSFAARSLVQKLGVDGRSGDLLAHRIYKGAKGKCAIEILNDATIAPLSDYKENQKFALAHDVATWLKLAAKSPVAAFGCVNRGIIIDELRALDHSRKADTAIARGILRWLADPSFDFASLDNVQIISPMNPSVDGARHDIHLRIAGRDVRLVALSVDVNSLARVVDRSARTIAGDLFLQVLRLCEQDAAARPDACPIRANFQTWNSSEAVRAWEEVLSHAEIAAGKMHSYRDIWGIIALSLLGSHSVPDDNGSIFGRLDRLLNEVDSSQGEERLEALMQLANYRCANSLFRSPVPGGLECAARFPCLTPVHSGLSLVDPSVWSGQCNGEVEAAMEGLALDELPSRILLNSGLLRGAWQPFDELVETAIVERVNAEGYSDSSRRRLISWLSGYLMRLVGISAGKFGNHQIIRAWLDCWSACEKGEASLPLALSEQVRSLLFPHHKDYPNNSIIVAALATRAEPVVPSGANQSPKLIEVLAHQSIGITVQRSRGRLVLSCRSVGGPQVLGELALDFSMLREALVCRGGHPGWTEISGYVEPRIERCRASSLAGAANNTRRLAVLVGTQITEIVS